MFSKKSNITANDFYNNQAIQDEFVNVDEIDFLDSIRFIYRIETNVKKIKIYCNRSDVSYYVGLNPLNDTYVFTSDFEFALDNTSEYYISIKTNSKIIIIDTINLL